MAIHEEAEILRSIVFDDWMWWTGSGSCGAKRRSVEAELTVALTKRNMTLDPEWAKAIRCAATADGMDGGEYAIRNTFIAASYAVQDSLERQAGGTGLTATLDFIHIKDDRTRLRWEAAVTGRCIDNIKGVMYSIALDLPEAELARRKRLTLI